MARLGAQVRRRAAIGSDPGMIGPTLARYFSARFLQMIGVVLAMTYGMVYVVDVVEMLRRTADLPGVSASSVAYLSLLRVPAASEQLMPFCVLCGAMAAFLDLSRKLELYVARAIGISVWGILVPPITIAIAIGVVAVTVLNPGFAAMKKHADVIEARIFGAFGSADAEMVWLRQATTNGRAILKAEAVTPGPDNLKNVSAYLFGPAGKFESEVDAPRATLLPGMWHFDHARILVPGHESRVVETFSLPTHLRPDEITHGKVQPIAVGFWDLPAVGAAADAAGLDATGYRLQFEMLLARPLMYVAMVLVAAAFSLRFFRFGGVMQMIGGGVGAGFMLNVATKLIGDLGATGVLSPFVAAWTPAVVGATLAAAALLFGEDG
jgi:lipopolysaccharide export system permease protein